MDDPATITVGDDGRQLAYATYGDPDGRPVVALHGVPGSRLGWALFDGLAADRDVRLIAPDRPGFGHSEFQRGRRLRDWPADVAALADHLDVDRYGLVAVSGGGPHAVACACANPERVRGLAIASTVTPPSTHDYAPLDKQALFDASVGLPGFSRGLFEATGWLADWARPQFRAALLTTAGAPDRTLFRTDVGDYLVCDAAEAFRQGGRGPAHDFPLVLDDWAIPYRDLDVPVVLFHGRQDRTVEPALARAFADELPDCDLHLVEGAHYSTLVHYAGAMLDAAVDSEMRDWSPPSQTV